MRILILTVIAALPLMAFGQKEEQQQQQQAPPQVPTNEAPATTEKEQPAQPATQPQTAKPPRAADERKQTDVDRTRNLNKSKTEARAESTNDKPVQKDVDRTRDVNKTEATTRSSSSTTKTKVNVQEYRSRHSEVFSLGRHPKDFFIQRYGERHFRLIGNTYFVFLDGCWVAVDVDGFTYTERVVCEGDPAFIEVVD